MTSVVAVRHIHFEDLGTIEPVLRAMGFDIQYVDATVEDLASLDPLKPDLMVFLGGPIGAFDDDIYPFVAEEESLVSRRLREELPTLGICLGAQLMARAMGASVYPMGVKEIGFSAVDLTSEGLKSALAGMGQTPVLHWHGDQFDVPDGARLLASTSVCPNQAFSVGNHALALQFHLEAETAMIEQWLVGHANELAQAQVDPRAIREKAAGTGNALALTARKVIQAWLGTLGFAAKGVT